MENELVIELEEDVLDISISNDQDVREILEDISKKLDLINGEVI